jgi:adenylate cyclase
MPKHRFSDHKPIANTAVAGLAVMVTLCSYLAGEHFGPIRKASTWLNDLRLSYLIPLVEQSSDVVVLAVNEETIATFPYRSPIARDFLAKLLKGLDDNHEVRAVGVDLIFDQPTVPGFDLDLQNVLRHMRSPLVIAAADSSAGLSARQLAYQDQYLKGLKTGSSVLNAEDGVVRTHFPGTEPDDRKSFPAAVARAAGIDVSSKPEPILFRRAARDFGSAIRVFPAHNADMLPAEWLDGRIVLIGATLSDRDRHRTPLSILGGEHEYLSGVLIHAQILAQLTSGTSVPQVSRVTTLVSLIVATILGLALALAPIAPVLRIAVGISLFLTYLLAAFSTTIFLKIPLPILTPLIAYALALAAATAIARQRERRQRVFLHRAFNQYVSAEIIDDLLRNPSHLRLGGELREMSFIFTDISGFTTMAERLAPERLVSLLSGYLDGLVAIALEHKGTIARFVGDGLLVFFGAPLPQDSHNRRAVECALAFDRFCEDYRNLYPQKAWGFGATRIGVHSGLAVVGNVGGSRRFEYTAHGDCVNVAARLEGANRSLGTRVCVSRQAAGDFPKEAFQPVGDLILKGKTEPIGVLTPWDNYSELDRENYLEAYFLMSQGNSRCVALLRQLSERRPNDTLLAFHLHRLRGVSTGIEIQMQEK